MRREKRKRGAFLTRAAAVTLSAVVVLGGQAIVSPAAYAQDPVDWTPGHGGQPPRPQSPATPQHPGGGGGGSQMQMPPMAGMPEQPALVDLSEEAPETEDAPIPGAINLKDQESFEVDGLLGDLCAFGPGKRVQGAFNNETGEFLPKRDYVRRNGEFAPRGPWETVRGQCHFPVLGAWDHPGFTRRITAVHQNRGTGDDYYELTVAYATAFDVSTSTGFSISKTVADDIFSTTKTKSRDHSWSWGAAHDVSRLRAMLIEPCTEVWLDATPIRRTVRVQPVFELFDHRFERMQQRMSADNWRLANPAGPRFFFSPGFHIDGTADRLLHDTTPDLIIAKRQRDLDDKLCA
ncbi:hypothetical protein KIK06_18545 [Nocardiopsis sp. EMB25]|uniref:hypothetical protein n=1 Tax=Nocardiopsis TaxID=2013 RepID=UPI00034BC870|nr:MULTISPECIES: hypothetical protein [Nocardiopsis]MCY9785893.1 hypothetical protein [Nocardiopsis sp. EMB25]